MASDHLLERRPAFRAEDFEEGGVGFEGRCIRGSRFYETQAEVQGRGGSGLFKVGNMRVEPDAEKGRAIIDAFFEEGEEGFHMGRFQVSGVRFQVSG